MPFRRLKLGNIELALGVDDDFAERMRQGSIWKMLYGHARRAPAATRETHERDTITSRIAAIDWYHTIDVGHGVVTPGMFDHRSSLKHYPIPERLDGMRVLDIATFDGFFAFEFERRGAAEVIALDVDTVGELDIPPAIRANMTPAQLQRRVGAGFALASELRQSKVKRLVCSVYDLTPERVGKVDFVFCGSLLLHLRDPLRALERIRSVTGALGVFVETYNPGLPMRCAEYKGGSQRSVWWSWSRDCLQKIIEDAGYSKTEMLDTFALMNIPEKRPIWHCAFRVSN